MKIKSLVLSLILVFGFTSVSFALRTTAAKRLVWEHDVLDLAGFFLYWALESDPTPRSYVDLKRIDIADPLARSVILLTVKPDSRASMCFRIEAYDLAGNESEFSAEACGYVGSPAVTGFAIE